MPNGGKTKVAIIGGGAAGVTAALELTATPELRERFDVTLHTLGWRLGGKGASGRNRDRSLRIEEHGLHVWFGFYDNSFEVLRKAYEEMPKPADAWFDTVDDAFHACDNILLWHECPPKKWKPVRAKLPPLPGLPGGVSWQMLLVALGVIEDDATPLIRDHPDEAAAAGLLEPNEEASAARAELNRLVEARPELGELEGLARTREGTDETWEQLRLTIALAEARAADPGLVEDLGLEELEHERRAASLLGGLLGPWKKFTDKLKDAAESAVCKGLLVYMGLDFVHAVWDVVVKDVFATGSWDALDDQELTAWLKHRGMSGYTAQHAPWLRGFYDLVFGFKGGDWTKPDLAAGAAIKSMLQIAFNSKGTVMWKMNAGMGDVVFSPMYQVLRDREVDVRFFQRVRRLELSADKQRVERIVVQPQARLKPNVPEYDPFVPEIAQWPCWPTEPDWEQLDNDNLQGDLAAAETTLEDESWDSGLPEEAIPFDLVVVAASVESVKYLCAGFGDHHAPFAKMLANASTVRTQACQLWFKKPLDEPPPDLGWAHGKDPISSAYVEPLDTHSDMSHLVQHERWDGAVASIAYFCGPLPHAGLATAQDGRNAAKAYAQAHVQLLEPFFPSAFANGTFDPGELTAVGVQAGSDRFLEQYWRANMTGSERYVQTPAGSVRHRLRPHQSGFPNLFLAGDWTRTGIDGGCVEAAVVSGRAAAKAIAGLPVPPISDTDPFPPVPPP